MPRRVAKRNHECQKNEAFKSFEDLREVGNEADA